MIYLIVGITTDKVSHLNSMSDFNYASQIFNGNMYIGYDKIQLYLVNIHTKTLTLIGER